MLEWHFVYRKCTPDCVVPLTADRINTVGSVKRCPHKQVYVCIKHTYSIGRWQRLSPVWGFKEYREAIRKLN